MEQTLEGLPGAEARPVVGTSVPLPAHVSTVLIQIALRTEPGRAYWDGYAAALVEGHPWVAAPPGALVFRPGPGEVVPRPPGPPAGEPNGRP